MGSASAATISALEDATGREADCMFLKLMIRHLEGAISRAEGVIELGSDPRVLQVAQSMKAGQTAESTRSRAYRAASPATADNPPRAAAVTVVA
jgi:uncharacterized protein (DUF305 family)